MPIKDPDNQTSMLSDNVASTRPQTLEPRIFSLNSPHALPYESFRIVTPKMPIKHTERLTSMLSDKQARNQPLKLQGARTPDGVKLYGTCCRRVCFSSLPYAGNSARKFPNKFASVRPMNQPCTPKMPIKHTERLTSMLSDKQARNQPLKLQGARTPDGVKLYGTCCRRVCFSSLPYAGNSALPLQKFCRISAVGTSMANLYRARLE